MVNVDLLLQMRKAADERTNAVDAKFAELATAQRQIGKQAEVGAASVELRYTGLRRMNSALLVAWLFLMGILFLMAVEQHQIRAQVGNLQLQSMVEFFCLSFMCD